MISQEAHLTAEVPLYLLQIVARFARLLRESHSVDQRSGVSARFAIAAAETVAASARHRGAVLGETSRWPAWWISARSLTCCAASWSSSRAGRAELAVLEHLLRRATADTAQKALGGSTSDRWSPRWRTDGDHR